jgi:hypothetical protein
MSLSQEQVDRYQGAIKRMVTWAKGNWQRFCAEPDPQAHYKGLAFWGSVGDSHMAALHGRLFAQRFLQDDGDFRMSPTCKGWLNFPASPKHRYLYSNGWIIVGLLKSGACDLAYRGLDFVMKFQDPRLGGFFSRFDPATGRIDRNFLDSSSTSAAGLAMVAAGRIEEARLAGDFIIRLVEAQPKPREAFYTSMRADGTLETDMVDAADQWESDGRKQKCLSALGDAAKEMTWLIGKPSKFLTRLHTATGEQKYLQAAKQITEFFFCLHPNAWTNYASCKTMWTTAELYRITGEQRYADVAVRLIEFFIKTQSPEGTWLHTLWYKNMQEQPFPWTADFLFEHGTQYTDVIYDLSSR